MLLAPGGVAAPRKPLSPDRPVGDIERKVGEGRPNGTIAALTDDDGAAVDADLLDLKWKEAWTATPHALAVRATPGTPGLRLG